MKRNYSDKILYTYRDFIDLGLEPGAPIADIDTGSGCASMSTVKIVFGLQVVLVVEAH